MNRSGLSPMDRLLYLGLVLGVVLLVLGLLLGIAPLFVS
jgi:hypothetical protein